MLPPTPAVDKPVRRSRLRRFLGREIYILKRRIVDARSDIGWASVPGQVLVAPHEVFNHSSLIRRELAGVDMALQVNKATNLRLAVAHIDGVVIAPGETFSLWRLVGRPTKRKGYLPGLVLDQGTIGEGVGGGLCQLSNLLFWLFAHSELSITERHRHLFDVFPDAGRTVPFGAGATIAYNYIDLRVHNSTATTFVLKLAVDETYLRGALLSDHKSRRDYRIVERDHRFDQQWWGGYSRHNRIVRQVLDANEVIEEHVLTINDALVMYSPVLANSEPGPGHVRTGATPTQP